MIDFYSAHVIAREEHEAKNRAIYSDYVEPVVPREPIGILLQIGSLLTGIGSALSALELRSKNGVDRETQPQTQIEQQPCLEC